MKRRTKKDSDFLGSGLLLNSADLEYLLEKKPKIDWFEIMTENLMGSYQNGYQIQISKDMEKFIEYYPVTLHGVELSIGSVDDFDPLYLKQLIQLKKRVKPAWVSDHLCWTGANNLKAHELLPLPYTVECIKHVVERIHYVQDLLQEPIVLENPPNYITYKNSEMTEWEFMSEIHQQTGCGFILDLNNLFVSSTNNHFDPYLFLDGILSPAVKQIHLAGHERAGQFILDTHSQYISKKVWEYYAYCTQTLGPITTSVEWDLDVPSFEVLVEEANKAKKIQQFKSNVA